LAMFESDLPKQAVQARTAGLAGASKKAALASQINYYSRLIGN
jgi:hypothetical protein